MKQILVLGDSHTPIFQHPCFLQAFPTLHFEVVTVIGATASGLENPNTKTQAYPIFKEALAQAKAKSGADTVIVMLGEVDTGFVIWYRAQKYQESVSAMATRAISSYSKFLLEVAAQARVICISTPLPTIQDGNDWGEIANARREVTATQRERTELTLQFNRQMQAFCQTHGIDHVMLDGASLGPDGLVKQELMNRNANDHHYEPEVYARLLVEHLDGVL